ncbi:GNAT family N-acetyltransferase [Streptomyces sp. NPDC127068]|uniref:GNAT family N-acetyltransferase n=1 Tax=Streptomyces sp. NPDC127068 TaxID=3347127 RepID=UPI00365FA331
MSRDLPVPRPAGPERRAHHWRRDVVELAALFTAVAVADAVANLIGHGPSGPALLLISAVVLLATAGFHTWWAHRSRRHDHPAGSDGTAPHALADRVPSAVSGPGGPGATELWRLRTTVRDTPGSLAALCAALAEHQVDILSLQTHPLAEGTVDELLVRAPAGLPAGEVARAAARAGGTGTRIERADPHDLVDASTRALGLATRTALDPAELPLALRQLLGRCTVRSHPAPRTDAPAADPAEAHRLDASAEGVLPGDTVLRLRTPDGGHLTVERPHLPFTPTEFARARALVELDTRLGPRVSRQQDRVALARGGEVTVRRASPADLAEAKALHERCSSQTLRMRYHGSVKDADPYLRRLLAPGFGRTLAARTASGRIVALGHLLWDGDETEVALLVEDAWQRRGIGSELLGRLVTAAEEAGCASVYAVTQASNTAMVAVMRGLGLPLDYQLDEGVLIITARLDGVAAGSRSASAAGVTDRGTATPAP